MRRSRCNSELPRLFRVFTMFLNMLALSSCGSESQPDVSKFHAVEVMADPENSETTDEETALSMHEDLAALRSYMLRIRAQKSAGRIVGTMGIFGGFSTCTGNGPFGAQVYSRALKTLKARAAKGEYFRVVAGCFKKSNKSIYYYSSTDFETLRKGGSIDIAKVVAEEVAKSGNNKLTLVGHSYGGWLAIRTALDVTPGIELNGLASIDPISATFCTPYKVAKAYLSSMLNYYPDPDCTSAPRDFTAVETKRLKERSKWWHNFYQNTSGYVHSGHIADAANKYIDYEFNGIQDMISGHVAIDNDERVWSVFENKI